MAHTTDALVVSSVGTLPKLTTVILSPIKPTEVLVQMHAAGICNTDLACMAGKLPAEFPNVLGHEGAGVVRQIGDRVDHVKVGDKVLLSYNFCQACSACRSNTPAYCDKMFQLNFGGRRLDGSRPLSLEDGIEIFSNFFGQSSFCRLAVVSQSSLVTVPQETPLELYAPLGCGFQTGAGSIINVLNVQPGSSVAISGVGSVGLSAIMAAKFRQAAIIIAIDINTERLELAEALGATHTLLGSDEHLAERVREICQPSNGVQSALDCSGVTLVISKLIDSLATRGRAVSVGASAPGKRVGVELFSHLSHGREYRGSHQGDSVAKEMIPFLIEQHQKGLYPLEKIVTYYNIDDYAQAFKDMKDGKVIKAVLKWV
ncbi:chaperonin 10-like protein [Ilyonectria robusta]|uniref:chaperonin 10-like protein n=1 Tax=Ilyonectria robusta TaxID=1079257 RepID=UPI001E8E30E4|nr:chaperonin 10-like protein [Ilyonectria robusta]KAH8684086.1 chaperonin 10-like protein [Ilyonectria robusta]